MISIKQVTKLAQFYVEQGYDPKEAITIAMYLLEEEEKIKYENKETIEYWRPKEWKSGEI